MDEIFIHILTGVFLIVVGLLVKRFPMLIAGYNTMPAEKKKNVDVAGLSSFMRRHLVIIGALWVLLAVVTSGTATLETALLGIPEVVVYRTLWFQVKLQPYVLNVPWVSLVNLNLGREAVAEIIQSGLDITRAERELRAVVEGGSKREKMLSDFDELRKVIGGPGASDRFAARMVAELHATEAQ